LRYEAPVVKLGEVVEVVEAYEKKTPLRSKNPFARCSVP
jgi:hypothetical protein